MVDTLIRLLRVLCVHRRSPACVPPVQCVHQPLLSHPHTAPSLHTPNSRHPAQPSRASQRLPFYILFVYVGFIYVAVIATWRIHWAPGTTGALGRAAASGIIGMLFYAPFDLAGAKFLWWSWHDSDAAVDARWCGVPVGSTMWTLVHGFCFHMLVYWCGCYEPLVIPTNILKKVNKKRIKRAANEKAGEQR